MKLDPISPKPDKKVDENTSPNPASNNKMSNMMKNWLTKSASKTAASDTTNKPDKTNKPENKKIDNSSNKVESKKVPESVEKAPKTETKCVTESSTKTKSSKITESKDEAAKVISKPKSKKEDKTSPEIFESRTKSKKTSSEKLDESSTSPKNKEKKATSGSKYYAAYMKREGPKNPGSKPVPIGKIGCFKELKFLTTGVLDSLNRDEVKEIIEKYGGTMISGVTKKLDYLIVGEDAGQSKLEKARELNIKQLNEDEFLKLICTKSGITNPKYEGCSDEPETLGQSSQEDESSKGKKHFIKQEMEVEDEVKPKPNKFKKLIESDEEDDVVTSKETIKKIEKKSPIKIEKTSPMKIEKTSPMKIEKHKEAKIESKIESKIISEKKVADLKSEKSITDQVDVPSQLWVEKYKPKEMSKIIGQMDPKNSNAHKLLNWLKNWNKFNLNKGGEKTKKPYNDDSGISSKAALLSGPPGIGKTTTAHLVCKEAGFTFIELNASDSRSKKLLDLVLGESSDTGSMDSYLKGKHKVTDVSKDQHCIIMDEVDGMAGNEDRGGILELINTIKSSKIPIICICNDRQHVKIRSLANYCFDLRFSKPNLTQIRSALMSVCFKEKITAKSDLIDQIIVGCNYDIRQCLHNLSIWSSNNKSLVSNQQSQLEIEKAMKDIRMNPFEACKQVFSTEQSEKKPRTMIDKMDYFFTDYSLMPLLVHENYLKVYPTNLKGNSKKERDLHHLQLLSDSIESMCNSDTIGKLVRNGQNWSLLPAQAIFATVVPGEKIKGQMGLAGFPSWFGKNSKQNRVDRILQELQKHMRISISANKIGVGMDYLSVLKSMLSKPLIKNGADGIPDVLKIMHDYCLTRDDFDTILELSTWPGQKDLLTLIDPKTKAAFTRAYNKESHKNPFSIVDIKKLKSSKVSEEMGEDGEIEDIEEEDEKDDISADAMIKIKKKAPSKAASVKRAADTTDKPTASKKKKV